MNISLNPSYLCNFRCSFCYLTPEQLGDKRRAQISEIDQRLAEIISREPITHIDLYGGEIGLLDSKYLDELFDTIRKYYDGDVNIITNLSKVNPVFLRDDVTLSVSYDFHARQQHVAVYTNMATVGKDLSVLVLASKEVLQMNVDEMIAVLNGLRNVRSVEIKPYSSNQSNDQGISFREYEDFISRWMDSAVDKEFQFINEIKILESLSGEYNAFSSDHIYITPAGKFAVLDFDEQDREVFSELDSLDDYYTWSQKEQQKVKANTICSSCPYLGRCLTEHYRDVKSLKESCNGFRLLLEKYDARHRSI